MPSLFPRLHRRAILLSGAAAAAATAGSASSAQASGTAPEAALSTGLGASTATPPPALDGKSTPADFSRGSAGERLPNLDLEGRIDYLNAQRTWLDTVLQPAAKTRTDQILKANGVDPEANLPLGKTLPLIQADPVIALTGKMYVDIYKLRFAAIGNALDRKAATLIADLNAADTRGPGKVELNPQMTYPAYSKREIHTQPGGTVGSALAGFLARYTFDKGAVAGRGYLNPGYRKVAQSVPTPADGKVRRLLELGCGPGQYTTQLKLRFPDAEVWGIDIGAPQVRYAHLKAVDMGLDINYSHRLAEDTQFPDAHFDVVTAFIFFHEIKGAANEAIIREAHRILRPGGVFYPVDYGTHAAKHKMDAFSQYQRFWAYRWFHEDWTMDYVGLDFGQSMRKAGFVLNENGPLSGGEPNFVGVKAA